MAVEIRGSFWGGGGTKALTLSRFLSRATFLKAFLGFGRFSAKGVQKHHAVFETKSKEAGLRT
jgi:hypothetical protein